MPLDTASCTRNPQGMCNILRIHVLKTFSFVGVIRIWERKCWWVSEIGRVDSGLNSGASLFRATVLSATSCRKGCHKPSRFRAAPNGFKQAIWFKEKGHVSVPLSMRLARRNNWRERAKRSSSNRTTWPSGRLRTPSREGLYRAAAGSRAQESPVHQIPVPSPIRMGEC